MIRAILVFIAAAACFHAIGINAVPLSTSRYMAGTTSRSSLEYGVENPFNLYSRQESKNTALNGIRAFTSQDGDEYKLRDFPVDAKALSSLFGPEPMAKMFFDNIIGKNPFKLVQDTLAFPYSAIGTFVNSRKEVCSGVYIGSNVILTAAHCLHTGGEKGGLLTPLGPFLRGKNCNPDKGMSDSIRSFHIFEKWLTSGSPDFDIALMFTNGETKTLPPMDIKPLQGSFMEVLKEKRTELPITIAGYPNYQNQEYCMLKSSCNVVQSYGNRLFHKCDSSSGMDGGPMYKQDGNEVYGVLTKGLWVSNDDTQINIGVAITEDMYFPFMRKIEENSGLQPE